MKNVIFALAFMLMGTFTFANGKVDVKENINLTYQLSEEMIKEGYSIRTIKIVNIDLSCSILHVVVRADGSQMGSFYIEAPDGHPDCNGVVFHMLK